MGTRRYSEDFRQALDTEVRRNLFTNARTLDTKMLLRSVDAEEVNKARLGRMFREAGMITRMNKNDVEEDWRQRQLGRRDLKYGTNAFEFSLGDMNRLPVLYYNTYGVGHNGSPCIDNDDSWTCPHCHRTFNTTLATLPDYCQVCGETTPMGRMIEDGILRR